MPNDNRLHARERLDTRFDGLRPLLQEPRSHKGWVRAIRDALGMSSAELGARLGVAQQTVVDIENSESSDSVKLETLRRVADALNCELVYFLIPRERLDLAVTAQAKRKAMRHLDIVSHHSRLEDQAVSSEDEAAQVDELASRLIGRRGLWSETPVVR